MSSTVTLTTAARNAACAAVTALVDAGGGAGNVVIKTSGAFVLVTFPFNATAFGAPSTGVATAAGFPKTIAATGTGTAAIYTVTNFAGTTIWSGTVGTSGEGINLDSLGITAAQSVTLNSFTHTQPA